MPATPWHRHTTAPRRPGAPAHSSPTTGPSFKTLSETKHNFLGGIGLHLGLGHVAFACAADTTKLATPGTCGCIFAAALLLPNQGQTNALDPITTQKKGDGFGQTTILVFQRPKCRKKSTGIYFISFCPKFPQRYFAKISYKIFRQNIMNDTLPKYPGRFFANIFQKIFYQNIPKDILPEYPAKYFARISRQIFCQNIPQDILTKICQHIPQDILPK